jgi:tripartite-type tricarboxylate transporter receptor subunit TctC
MSRWAALLCLAFAAASVPAPAAAQCAAKSVRLVVPTPAGGPSDTAARTLAQALAAATGQAYVVENRPGAGGAIAAQAVRAAAPDGCTLLWTLASMAAIPMLQKSPPFQSLADFTPVSLVGRFAFALFVHPEVPAASLKELAAYGRAHPDRLAYATGTLGEYMAGAQVLKAAGISAVRVPYKGGAQLMPDLVSGRVQLNVGPVSSGLQHVREGRLKMLAVLLPRRLAAAPDVPTLAESGLPPLALPTWQAVFAPPGTPSAAAAKLSQQIAAALADPALRARLEQQALQVEGSTPEALAAVAAADADAWRAFIRDHDIPME